MDERRGQGQVARAAKHEFGRLNQAPGQFAQALDAILADADNRQPPGWLIYVSVVRHATQCPDPGRYD